MSIELNVVNFDSQKQESKEEREAIENEMLDMAQGMKEYANNFKTQFRKDEKLIDTIAQKQDKGIQQTNKELEKITKS
jgi:hypothetical protein